MQYCPHPELQRYKRRWYEVPLSWFFHMQPYRCCLCHKRLWRYSGVWYRDLAVVAVVLVVAWLKFGGSDQVDPLLLAKTSGTEKAQQGLVTDATFVATPAPIATQQILVADNQKEERSAPVSATEQPAAVRTDPPNVTEAVPQPKNEDIGSRGNVLLDAQVLSSDDHFQLQLKYAGSTSNPRLIRLQAPSRLVLDVPGEWSVRSDQMQTLKGDDQFVRQIRFGKHADSMRIVLDLSVDAMDVKPLIKMAEGSIFIQLSL